MTTEVPISTVANLLGVDRPTLDHIAKRLPAGVTLKTRGGFDMNQAALALIAFTAYKSSDNPKFFYPNFGAIAGGVGAGHYAFIVTNGTAVESFPVNTGADRKVFNDRIAELTRENGRVVAIDLTRQLHKIAAAYARFEEAQKRPARPIIVPDLTQRDFDEGMREVERLEQNLDELGAPKFKRH